ncbi:MAG: hypothetical protein JNJ94_16955 [Chlorobi bacterium]|nr:hypothetical protein [Chlorobiota bacterium]
MMKAKNRARNAAREIASESLWGPGYARKKVERAATVLTQELQKKLVGSTSSGCCAGNCYVGFAIQMNMPDSFPHLSVLDFLRKQYIIIQLTQWRLV